MKQFFEISVSIFFKQHLLNKAYLYDYYYSYYYLFSMYRIYARE